MRTPQYGLAPIALAVETIEALDGLTIRGIDLESGARIVITMNEDPDAPVDTSGGSMLGFVLSISLVGP